MAGRAIGKREIQYIVLQVNSFLSCKGGGNILEEQTTLTII